MKKILLGLLGAVILFLVFSYRMNNNPQAIIAGLDQKGIVRTGDLKYRIYLFGIFPVGEALINAAKQENYLGQPVFHLAMSAQTLKALSKFFSASINLDSYVSEKDNNPVAFKQKIMISGRPDVKKDILYDQQRQIMIMGGVERIIQANTQDPVSALFNLRKMDSSITGSFQMYVNTNQKNYLLDAKVSQRDIQIKGRKYKCILLKGEIRRKDKNPYHRSRMEMLMLDEGKAPVLIKVFSSGALITAKLIPGA